MSKCTGTARAQEPQVDKKYRGTNTAYGYEHGRGTSAAGGRHEGAQELVPTEAT